jgi:hypothetical protein
VHRPSATALKSRARILVEQMTERARWIYALPPADAKESLAPTLETHGLVVKETNETGTVTRWANPAETATFVVLERADLDVVLVEAQGGEAAGPLGALVAKVGFYAQSTLLASAFDVASEDARKALLTLAHMVVVWDDDWADLFVLHLASPDPIVRHDAVMALTVAALVAREKGPCPELLAEAAARETFPKLRETIDQARSLIDAITPGEPS